MSSNYQRLMVLNVTLTLFKIPNHSDTEIRYFLRHWRWFDIDLLVNMLLIKEIGENRPPEEYHAAGYHTSLRMLAMYGAKSLTLPSGIFSQTAAIMVYFSIFKKTIVKFDTFQSKLANTNYLLSNLHSHLQILPRHKKNTKQWKPKRSPSFWEGPKQYLF